MANKRDKFVELAEKRVTRAIKQLNLIGNLSNRHNYAYTDRDAKKILSVLEAELKLLRSKFLADQGTRSRAFKL